MWCGVLWWAIPHFASVAQGAQEKGSPRPLRRRNPLTIFKRVVVNNTVCNLVSFNYWEYWRPLANRQVSI